LAQTTIRYKDAGPFPSRDELYQDTNDSTRIQTVKNALQWSNFKPFQEVSAKKNFFQIAGGLLHDYANIKFMNTPFTSLYVFGRTHIRLFNVMDIFGQISYSLISDYANNDASAKAGISWAINREKEHIIGLNAAYYRNDPEYIMQHIFNDAFRWINFFSKQNIAKFSAYWNYQKYNLSVNYYYLNHLVYLSDAQRPMQHENDGNLIQVSAFAPFMYKNFGITTNLNLQYCSNDVINVPFFAGKLSVFYVIELLKKRLKIQVGSDIMYNTSYFADAYFPVLHKFYLQRYQKLGNFIFWDANLTVKIDRINFFFCIGNLLPPFMYYRNFTTPDYPIKEYLISLGITWQFFD
jgi:hypothetical protein